MNMSNPIVAAATVLALWSSPAGAQASNSSTHVPSSEACGVRLPEAPELVAVRELFLAPGRKLSFADIPPGAVARMAEAGKIDVERAKKDWANLCRFSVANRTVIAAGIRPRVVFLGDSITENWEPADSTLFDATSIDRGIGGQTTAQMVLRFYPDVVALKPRVVHIMAGTNDVGANLGPVSDDTIVDNIRSMIDMAHANRIKVVLASIPPAKALFWNPSVKPAARIRELNRRLQALAVARDAVWVDYHYKLTDADGGLPDTLANDGVHPNRSGYAIMRPLAEQAIRRAAR
jgi:lysophospholipase L1-like esterase